MKDHKTVEVAVIPDCDLCNQPAAYDARIPGQGWANVCSYHFKLLGCKVGLGNGQQFILKVGKDNGN